jgi:hypothetical protein
MLIQVNVLEYLISKGPGRTAVELARAIHGGRAYQPQVNQDCALLVASRKAERRGGGGVGDPYRYFPLKPAAHAGG